jgi:hypothetical protein
MRSLALEAPVKSRFMWALLATIAAGLLLNHGGSLRAQQLSEGQPHKWEAVTNKSMYDFVADGFELKSVAYDTSVLGPQSDSPDVHYFLQKGADLVRCDFRKRDQTSYYWCYRLAKIKQP